MVALGAFHFHSQVHQNYFAVLEVSHRHVQPLFLKGVKPKSQIYLNYGCQRNVVGCGLIDSARTLH